VTVRQGNRREVWDDVRQGRADVGLTFGEPPPDAALSRRSLYEDPLVAVLPSSHRLAREESVAPEDLATEPILATQPGCGFRGMLDARIDEWQGARVVAELASVAGVCGCVATGMGWALLPATAVESWVVRGELAAVPMRGAGFRTPVTVTWLRARENHPNITAFVDCAMAHARPVRIEEWPRAHVHDVA
jgi:DNA-binding transcriptional LysR family regulator